MDFFLLAPKLILLLFLQSAYAGCGNLCDINYSTLQLTKSATITPSPVAATFESTTMTFGYLDSTVVKPASGEYFPHNKCNANWADCGTYTVSVSLACQSLLYWNALGTLPCSTDLTFTGSGGSFALYAIAGSSDPNGTTACTLSISSNAPISSYAQSTAFSISVVDCDAYQLSWFPTSSFSIAAQTYYVGAAATLVGTSFADQTNACGYSIAYSILNSDLTAAASAFKFEATPPTGQAPRIQIQTSDCLMAGSYSLIYRASVTNLRTSLVVNLDAPFVVTIVSCCSGTIFDLLPLTTLNTMSTTALSPSAVTQALQIKDSVSIANGNLDGWTYCGNRVFTINSGMSPQTFLSVTSNSLSSTLTLLSNQLSDATACGMYCPSYTVEVKVCLFNFPLVCTTTHPSLTVNILNCVVTSYTGSAQADVSYIIGSATTYVSYPTFTQTPACAYTAFSKSITVNSAAFPGTNLNGGASMTSIFSDDTANSRISILDTIVNDGTNDYNFVFTSTITSVTPTVSGSVTFKITLVNPCLTTVVQNSGQSISFTGTELQTTATPSPALVITQFMNSVSATSVLTTTACGPYTYSLTSYTGSFLQFNSATPSLALLSVSNTDNSASPYSVGLTGCLTNYPLRCYTKTFTVTINDCIILNYAMTTGQTALSSISRSYSIGNTALVINLPTFTQSPACGFTETKTCFLTSSPTACPSWLTATQTTWTIYCNSPAACPAGTYYLVMQSMLSNTFATSLSQTQVLYVYDPCLYSRGNSITAGAVNSMTTSALSTASVTQTLSYWTDTASSNAGVTTMCGPSTFSLVSGTYSPSQLSLSGTTITLVSTSLSDVGTDYVQIRQCLSTAAYSNVCRTVTFNVVVVACVIVSFTAPTIAPQSFTIYTGSTLSISIPTYTQSPVCGYSVTYQSQIQKTSNANSNRVSYFPDFTSKFNINSNYVDTSPILYFITYSSYWQKFDVYTDDLRDGGTYMIYVTATVSESVYQALDINTDLSFQLNLADPCESTVVNNMGSISLNVAPATITTSVKYSGLTAPFSYKAVTYQFYTYMDTISYDYGQYAYSAYYYYDYWNGYYNTYYSGYGYSRWYGTERYSTSSQYLFQYTKYTNNYSSIYCGPRTYVFGGAASPMPAWLSLNSATGTLSVQTADDLMVNFSPGYDVTLTACLQYYPTVCSAPVTFTVIIYECQIVTFVRNAVQSSILQSIFDVAVSKPIVGYTQTPLCGWTLSYTAQISSIQLPYSGSVVVGQSVVTGNPVWATLDTTPSAPQWIMQSMSYLDDTVFTINQIVTLNDQYYGSPVQTSVAQTFTVQFQDPCLTSSCSLIRQNSYGESFDTTSSTVLISTSVKIGTDYGASGTPATYTFGFHHDTISDVLTVGTPDSSNWVCGPRTHIVTIKYPTSLSTNFISIVDSPTVSTLTQPFISVFTSSDADIGTWEITLTISLTRYSSVTTTETFFVKIDQCILNDLTEDVVGQIRSPISNPTVFLLYANYVQNLPLPTYTQVPACGYQLSYTLQQIQTWNQATLTYDSTLSTCSFASFNSPTSPSTVNFQSVTFTHDKCSYGPADPTLCDLANSHPYLLMLTAYVNPALIATGIVFQKTQNTDEQFYLYPQDLCHSATLTPTIILSKMYFLGDSELKITVPTTKDSISKNLGLQYLVDGSGTDKCGQRNYQLYTLSMSMPSFATVTTQQDPPIITVQTSNAAIVGAQTLKLVTSLANYTHVSTETTFTVTIYNFKIGKAIPLQYYQITKTPLLLTWAQFTLSPLPPFGTMTIYYTQPEVYEVKSGTIIAPSPVWLTADTTARTLKIFTNQFSDQGVYDIVIFGSVSGYTFSRNQTVRVNITKTPPPQLSTAAPNFTLPLVNLEFKMGDELSWTLPATQSVGNFAVKASLSQAPKWLKFDPKTLTFTISKGSTKMGDTGDLTITVQLQDTAGGKGAYSFKLTCIAPPIVLLPVFNTTAQVAYPIPKITMITKKGQVTVVWDQQMRIPRNLTQVQNGSCIYVNPLTQEIETQPNMEVYVIPGNLNVRKNLTFTWNFTSWDTKAMIIQLYFQTPEEVSSGPDLERLKLTFFGMSQFVSQNGIPVNGGRNPNKNSIPTFKIPPQIAINQAPVVRRNNKAGMTTNQIGPMLLQLSISAVLNSVWGMVDTQQIIILLPLFDIVLPQNAGAFFAQLMTIAAFAIIPTDPIFGFLLQAPPNDLPQPLSENFMAVGFATTYITNNMGTLFFSLMYFPIMVLVYYIIKRIHATKIMKARIGLGRKLFWSKTFQTFSDQYTIIATCSLIQLANLDWTKNYGTQFCSFLGCLYTGVAILLPFVVSYICWKNYDKIKSGDQDFKQRFYSMWEGLSTDDRGFIVYHWYFLLRRFMIGVLCVFCRKVLFYQISGLVFNIIFGTIIAGNTLCMEDKRLNTIEYFNETMIMMVMYCLICFTDFVPDADTKSQIGVVCESFVIFHIVFNLSFLFGDYIINLKMRYKRWALYRKYAKTRAIKNYKLQKKLREQRFAQHIKRNEDIQKAIEKKRLQPIQEESQDNSRESNNELKSYEYAEHINEQSGSNDANSSKFENSEQDLEFGNHREITKGISRQPAEAPLLIHKHILREFDDNATTTDQNQNKKLALSRPVEFAADMEQQAQRNLVRRIPFDSIFPDLQGIMNEADFDENKDQSYANKLKRKVVEAPLDIMQSDPLTLIHNRLARMVQHDVQQKSSKVKPGDLLQGELKLKILPDTNAIHSKLFQIMEAGDAAKVSGTEAYRNTKNAQIGKNRKKIVTDRDSADTGITRDAQGRYFGRDGKQLIEVPDFKFTISRNLPKTSIREKVARNDLDDLIEEEKVQTEDRNQKSGVKDNEVDRLITELQAEAGPIKKKTKVSAKLSESDIAHITHVKLFGHSIGKPAQTAVASPRQMWGSYVGNSKLAVVNPEKRSSSQLPQRPIKQQVYGDMSDWEDKLSKK